MLESPVLVLNRGFAALTLTDVKRTFTLFYKGHVRAVLPDYTTYAWDEWQDIPVQADDDVVTTPNLVIRVPRVIQLLSCERSPRNDVKFSRHNIYMRDGNRCQYCGKRFSTSDLSLDHVIPLSRGGPSNWDNIVCACLLGNAVALLHVAGKAGADDVVPVRRPPARERDHVIEREVRRGKALAAILAAVPVAHVDVVPREFHLVAGRALAGEKLNDTWHPDHEIRSRHDVVVGLDRDILPLVPGIRRVVGQDRAYVPFVEKRERPLDVRQRQGREAAVQDQHRRLEHGSRIAQRLLRLRESDADPLRTPLVLRRRRLRPSRGEGAENESPRRASRVGARAAARAPRRRRRVRRRRRAR